MAGANPTLRASRCDRATSIAGACLLASAVPWSACAQEGAVDPAPSAPGVDSPEASPLPAGAPPAPDSSSPPSVEQPPLPSSAAAPPPPAVPAQANTSRAETSAAAPESDDFAIADLQD